MAPLLDGGVLIRDVGLQGWRRVTAGTPEATDAFLEALREERRLWLQLSPPARI